MFICLSVFVSDGKTLHFFIYFDETMCRGNIAIYFIPSSEFNAYLKQIKVVLSTIKEISYFFH